MGSEKEDGTRMFEAPVLLWSPLVFHGVEFAGGELYSLQIPDKDLVALHRTAANYTLFFKPSIRKAP